MGWATTEVEHVPYHVALAISNAKRATSARRDRQVPLGRKRLPDFRRRRNAVGARHELCGCTSGQWACAMMHAVVSQTTVLAINAGSASVKSALFTFEANPRPLQRAVAEPDASQVQDLL